MLKRFRKVVSAFFEKRPDSSLYSQVPTDIRFVPAEEVDSESESEEKEIAKGEELRQICERIDMALGFQHGHSRKLKRKAKAAQENYRIWREGHTAVLYNAKEKEEPPSRAAPTVLPQPK